MRDEETGPDECAEVISGHTLARSCEVLPTLIHLLPEIIGVGDKCYSY